MSEAVNNQENTDGDAPVKGLPYYEEYRDKLNWFKIPLILIGYAAYYFILDYYDRFTYTAAVVTFIVLPIITLWKLSWTTEHVMSIWRGNEEKIRRYDQYAVFNLLLPSVVIVVSSILEYISSATVSYPVFSTPIGWIGNVCFDIALILGLGEALNWLSAFIAKFISYDLGKIKASFPKRIKGFTTFVGVIMIIFAMAEGPAPAIIVFTCAILGFVAFYALWFAVRLATNIVKRSRATSSS